MKKAFLIGLFFLLFFSFGGTKTHAISSVREEILEGKIIDSIKEDIIIREGKQYLYQELKVLITKGSLKDKEVIIEVGDIPIVGQPKYKPGDEVLVSYSQDFNGDDVFFITDFIRRQPLILLFLIFIALATFIGRWRGVSSLLGLGISFLIIFLFILPNIYKGYNPVFIAIIGSIFIVPATFYLSHGFNQKTTMAILGTLIALIITGILAKIFVDLTRLTGYASEEAAFLQVAKPGVINIRGLILAGIIIGVLGVLDDVTISQAAVVQQLKEVNPKIKLKQLFARAMSVGKDHIASMINTLILVYTGAALPLLLLFIDNPRPFGEIINYEIIADEVIRTLVGSIGLILAVPITTLLVAWIIGRD